MTYVPQDDVMSFSSKVRDELLSKLSAKEWTKSTALTALSSFSLLSLKAQPGQPFVLRVSRRETARLISDLARHVSGQAQVVSKGKRDQQIELDLKGQEWELINYDFYAFVKTRPQSDWWNILAPLFLAAGSMSDPLKRIYHLEISPLAATRNEELCDILLAMELPFRQTGSNKRKAVYLSSGDDIADFLRLSGAHLSLLRFEEVRSELELLGTVQRQVNFDEANIERMTKAVGRQMESIDIIERSLGLESIPLQLAETARLRLENPELSLADLGELMTPPIGKSGVSHRMRRLHALADKIIESQE